MRNEIINLAQYHSLKSIIHLIFLLLAEKLIAKLPSCVLSEHLIEISNRLYSKRDTPWLHTSALILKNIT